MPEETQTEPDWYEVVKGAELEQGDILRQVPIPLIDATSLQLQQQDDLKVSIEFHDVCVLTQSCDLANKKVNTVMLGRVASWADVVRVRREANDSSYATESMRKKVQQGQLPGLCLLHRRTLDPTIPWSIVDFHTLFVLPRATVESHADSQGERLRLASPYKEHLAQAFARYFMRVGLPHDARAFIKDSGA